jgi:hypothetical protein
LQLHTPDITGNTKKINVLVILRSKAAREFTTTSAAKADRFVHKFVVILNKNTVIFYKIPATKEFKNDKYTVYTELMEIHKTSSLTSS